MDVRMLKLCLYGQAGQQLFAKTTIQLPNGSEKELSAIDLGPFVFDNLRMNAGQNFAVALQCFADEQLQIGLLAFT